MSPRVSGEQLRAEHQARLATLAWTDVGVGHCPRWLVDQPCRGPECYCQSRLADHGATYRIVDGRHIVAWEPYQADPSELFPVAMAAQLDDIYVCLDGQSPWNPGHTLAIIFAPERPKR